MIRLKHIFPIVFVFFMMACNTVQETPSGKPMIVCTTNIIADIIRGLAGDEVQVISLMGPGVDPHLYKASQKDLEYLQKADVVIENGLHLEGKMAEILRKLARSKKIITLSDGLREDQLILVAKNIHDPHIWFDVELWNLALQHASSELQGVFPEIKDSIKNRAEIIGEELTQLNRWVLEETEKIDPMHRVLITAHDAFSYFGRAYHFEVKGLQGISTQSDYGLQDISRLVNFITERKIKALFVETSVPEKPLIAVIEGCAKKDMEVVIGGSLYSDALGSENEPGNSYVNMVKHNVNTIVNALR